MSKTKKKYIEYSPVSENGLRWVENVNLGLRFVGFADKLGARGINHKGWYTDENGYSGEVLRGIVYRLPARHGKTLFVCGYADPYNDNAACLETVSVETEIDAAHRADHIAQHEAEKQKVWNAAFHAGSRYSDIREEISNARNSAIELIKAIRQHRGQSVETVICQTLRQHVASWLRDIAKLKKERTEIINDYSWHWCKDLVPAFNDGAGEMVIPVS